MDDIVAFITGGGSASGRQQRSCWPNAAPESHWQAGHRINSPKWPKRLAEPAAPRFTVTCDVSDEDSVRSAIVATVETWGATRCSCR